MKNDTVLNRSFGQQDRRKLGFGVILCFLIITFIALTVFKPYLKPLPASNLQFSFGSIVKMLALQEANTTLQADLHIQSQLMEPICNFLGPRSDFCNMSGDIRIHGNSSTVFVSVNDQTNMLPRNSSYTIRPYALKGEEHAMSTVREFTVKIASHSDQKLIPRCNWNHSVIGIVFSIRGYAGNIFHDFTDVIIPLYLTSREFNGEVRFLVTNKQSWWLNKYEAVIKKLSKYNIIDIDAENGVHCFPKMIVGLKRHKAFGIDPSISPSHSMANFRMFLREVYSLKGETAIQLRHKDARRPRLMILTRRKTRVFINEGEIVESATSLGFKVIATEGESNIERFSSLVNSCDVMVGIHGAGLTNMLFLPNNAVLIQIVPFGGLEELSRNYLGYPAKDMNLRYLEYVISLEESSLMHQYPPDHPVLRDPHSIHKQGWVSLKEVYLEKQNVTLDVARFRTTLSEAKKLLHL